MVVHSDETMGSLKVLMTAFAWLQEAELEHKSANLVDWHKIARISCSSRIQILINHLFQLIVLL